MYLEKEDWEEPRCCFDTGGAASEIRAGQDGAAAGPENAEPETADPENAGPDSAKTESVKPETAAGKRRRSKKQPSIQEVIAEFDSLLAANLKKAAQNYLERWLKTYEETGDWASQITILNEMMGFYRNNGKQEKGLESVQKGLALIAEHRLEETVSGGTTFVNAATTYKTFGESEKALRCYEQAFRAYGRSLTPGDYRYGSLFNNMAVLYADMGEFKKAGAYYDQAMSIMEKLRPGSTIEIGLTWVNLAMLYEKSGEEDKIDGCMEQAIACFHDETVPHDAYYALNCRKCAKTFGHFGYFRMQKELTEEADRIYAEARAQR